MLVKYSPIRANQLECKSLECHKPFRINSKIPIQLFLKKHFFFFSKNFIHCDKINMAKKYNVNIFADAVINWGYGGKDDDDEDDIIDQLYDLESSACLKTILLAVIDFKNAFEVEFLEIFTENCTANMSKSQFTDFINTRCCLLGKIEGYFGIILPCAFVREVMYRFKSYFQCERFYDLAETCLAKFVQIKFKEFESRKSIWDELINYCTDINDKFVEKIYSKHHSSFEKSADGDSNKKSVVPLNPDQIEECNQTKDVTDFSPNYGEPHVFSTKSELIVSDTEWAKASDPNSGDSLSFFDNSSIPRTEDTIQKGTKEFSELNFGVDDKQHKTEDDPNDNECSETDELTEMYNIIMPNNEFRKKVFKVVNRCFNFVSKTDIENFCF